jgi:Helix-turn-helix domain
MTDGPVFARIPARAAGMGLTANDWSVLHVICLHADKAGHSYPSLMRIAAMARIRRNHVSRSTKRLAQLGLVRSERLSRGSGWANTRYEIVFDGVAPEAGAPSTAPEAGAPSTAPEVGAPSTAPEVGAPSTAPEVGAPIPRVAPEVVQGGTSSGALTDQGTDSYQERKVKGVK